MNIHTEMLYVRQPVNYQRLATYTGSNVLTNNRLKSD